MSFGLNIIFAWYMAHTTASYNGLVALLIVGTQRQMGTTINFHCATATDKLI